MHEFAVTHIFRGRVGKREERGRGRNGDPTPPFDSPSVISTFVSNSSSAAEREKSYF